MNPARAAMRRRLAAAVAITCAGCGGEEIHTPPPVPVTVWTVAASSGGGNLRYSANIRPDVEVDLAFKAGGYVEEILSTNGADGRQRHVQEGDFVRRGTVLARVRDNEYRDRVTEADAALTQARADFNRAVRLYENQSIAKADYDASHAGLTAAQARHAQAVQALDDCRLVAPMDGWLLKRNIEVGTLANPGTAAFVLADTRSVKAVFGVPDVLVGRMRMGEIQMVTTEAMPGIELRGQVTRIAPSADATSRVFEVECTIPNGDNRLKVGMVAALQLGADETEGPVMKVPISTIVRPRGATEGYAVFVVDGAGGEPVARARRVTLGDVVGNSVVVLDGLQGGETVIVRGSTLVIDGSAIRVIP
ncbi:MAG: efflux RND transporter periplasmic adaptor subunit [Candidatus Eiseniibacteriota bacterium]